MNVSVIGSGTMGNGIAQVFAMKDNNVCLVDVSSKALDAAISRISINLDRMVAKEKITNDAKNNTLKNIHTYQDIKKAVAESDLVVEAVSEDYKVKESIFKILDGHCKTDSILATNTSSISITTIGSFTQRPEKVVGMHFMNPVPVMKLIEVIRGYKTSDETTLKVMEISRSLDKFPVEVNDYPGFVANRILMPMINEAIYSLHEGVAGVSEIDTVMKLGMNHPMGPLQLADFIGLDVCLSIMNVLYDGFGNPKYSPCPLLVNMVNSRNFGVKTGEGFYIYSEVSKDIAVSSRFSG